MKLDIDLSDTVNDVTHPIDCVEKLCADQQYSIERFALDQMATRVHGDYGPYTVEFAWDENFGSIEIMCKTGWQASDQDINVTARALSDVNAQLILGHFDIAQDDDMICFRHSLLFRGDLNIDSFGPVLDVLKLAIAACDRFHGLFALLKDDNIENADTLNLALMSVEGHA